MAKTRLYKIHFADECWPQIRCGQRTVSVQIGRKWVRITDPATSRKKRLTVAAWQALQQHALPVCPAAQTRHAERP